MNTLEYQRQQLDADLSEGEGSNPVDISNVVSMVLQNANARRVSSGSMLSALSTDDEDDESPTCDGEDDDEEEDECLKYNEKVAEGGGPFSEPSEENCLGPLKEENCLGPLKMSIVLGHGGGGQRRDSIESLDKVAGIRDSLRVYYVKCADFRKEFEDADLTDNEDEVLC